MYRCQFCEFETNERSLIHKHHIIPKELQGSNKETNRVYVCANCHGLIYIPESQSGPHSIQKENSIIIKGWLSSTSGRVLHYSNGAEEDYLLDKNP